MRTRVVMVLGMALLLAGCGRKAVVHELAVVPEPVFSVQKEGSFTLHGTPKLSVVGLGQNSATVKYIMKSLRQARMRPKLVAASQNSDVELVLYDTVNPELGDEGYLLEVRSTGITLSANTEQGIFYGFQTLLQMLPPDVTSTVYSAVTLPECTVLDYPRFAWRGAHLDASGQHFPVKFVKKYLDVMATYKMNRFHFQGRWEWEESRLRDFETSRLRDDLRSRRLDDSTSTAVRPYSREEVEEIVRYAAERGIEVVPEVDLVGGRWKGCMDNDSTLAQLKAVVEEVCDVFPSRYVHVGSGAAASDEEPERSLVASLLAERGRTMVRQCSVSSGQCSVSSGQWTVGSGQWEDGVMLSREGLKRGMEVARAGGHVVMCPEEFCDLACYQADRRYQPASKEGLITLRKAYGFDPAPMGTNVHVEANILGGQCFFETSRLRDSETSSGLDDSTSRRLDVYSSEEVEYMLLPRLLAISESLWSPRERRDWSRFRRKVEAQKERLGVRGYSYCEGSFTPQFSVRRVDENTMNVSIDTEVPNTYIFYTTDRSTPTRESAIYLGPINLRRGTHIKILPLYKDIERDSVYEFVIK